MHDPCTLGGHWADTHTHTAFDKTPTTLLELDYITLKENKLWDHDNLTSESLRIHYLV